MTPLITVQFVLILAAFITALLPAKCPPPIPIILLCVVALIQVLPLGKT